MASSAAAWDEAEPIVELREFVVTGAGGPIAEASPAATLTAGPSARGGVFLGVDTLTGFAVTRVEDFDAFVPGLQTPARFGVATVPNIRGDAAETYVNGQRRSGNLFGFRPSFAALAAIEIVKGPGDVVMGPGSKTGGTMNLIHRNPLAMEGGEASAAGVRIGTWVPSGGSYRETEWHLRSGFGLGGAVPARAVFTWSGRESETWFKRNGGRDDYQALHFALGLEPSERVRWTLFFEYQWSSAPQTLGVNRPSRDLIRENRYITGDPDPEIGRGHPPGPLDPGVADPGLLNPGPEDVVDLDPRAVLMSEGDYGNTNAWMGQSIVEVGTGGDWDWVNRTLVDHAKRRKENGFLYLERARQLTFENRLEATLDRSAAPLPWTLLSGGTLRHEFREGFTNYWNEFAYAFDISEGTRFDARERFAEYLAPGAIEGPGGDPFYAPTSPLPTPETARSRVWNFAAFARPEMEIAENWHLSVGARGDLYRARVREALAPEGAEPLSESGSVATAGYEIALRHRGEAFSAHLLWNSMHAFAGNTVSDGINLYPGEGMREEDFKNRTKLLEGGARRSFASGRVHTGVVAFWQERVRREFFGPNDIRAKGVEMDLDVRAESLPVRFFANAAYLDARYIQSAPAEFGGGSIGNVYARGAGPEGLGTGFGYIGGFFLNSLPPADYRLPGVSRWTINGGAVWRVADPVEVRLWWRWQSEQDGNLAREFRIPAQHEGNLSVAWMRSAWRLSLDLLNLTDERNWIHNGDTFFNNMFLSRALPRRVQVRFDHAW